MKKVKTNSFQVTPSTKLVFVNKRRAELIYMPTKEIITWFNVSTEQKSKVDILRKAKKIAYQNVNHKRPSY